MVFFPSFRGLYLVLTASLLVVTGLLLLNASECNGFVPPSVPPPLRQHLPQRLPTDTLYTHSKNGLFLSESNANDNESSASSDSEEKEGIDLGIDERLYRIQLPRAPGIEWGTDLSFSFVYVRAMDPTGPAAMSGEISVGDQLCELRPVAKEDNQPKPSPVNLLGAPFDFVMTAFASLDKTVTDVDLVFFRGNKEELKAAASSDDSGGSQPESVTITVLENKGSTKEVIKTIEAPVGCNVREILVDNDINVYQSITRWTNCKGKQLCGTCIINVTEGAPNTNRKSMDEGSTLRENPDSYRLSCITFAYGDVTVETFPPIKAAQWTR